ncbi:hypothetical protein ACYSNX_01790 [Myroides sp. LJL115]
MTTIEQKLQEIKENGLSISPSQILQLSFQYYKRTILSSASGLMFLGFAFSFILSTVLIRFVSKDPEQVSQMFLNFDPLSLTSSEMAIYLLVGSIVSAVASIFVAGFIYSNYKVSVLQMPRMFDLFRFIIKKQALSIFIAQFSMSIIFSSISFSLQLVGLNLVALAINSLINILLVFVVPLIIFTDMSPFKAISNSVMVVNKKPFTFILVILFNYLAILMVIMLLLSLGLGPFFLVLGIFLSLPFLFSTYFALYASAIGIFSNPTDTKQ